MSHAPLRSILAKLPNPTVDRGIELEALKRRAWHERAEACINVRDPRLT